MDHIFKNWRNFLNESKVIKEVYHIFDIPPELNNDPRIDDYLKELGVIDLALETYDDPQIFQSAGYPKVRVPRRYVKIPYINAGKKGYLIYDGVKKEFIDKAPEGEEIAVLPSNWYIKSLERLTERKIRKKRNLSIIKTLAVFDFDRTLYNSPDAPKNYKGNWHIKKESLPEKPKESSWNLDIVNKAQELCEDPSVYCVMMTGRIGNIFKDRIERYFKTKGLKFARTYYNEFGGDTAQYKMDSINDLLNKLPNVENLLMWDDDREKAEKYSEEFGEKINYKIHMVGDEEINESKFEDVKYNLTNVGLIRSKKLFVLLDTQKLINFVSKLPKDNPDMDSNSLIDNNIILSYAAVTPNDKLDSPCMGAAERTVLAQNPNIKGSGMGRYMMRVLFKFYPNGIMNDRHDVSKSAKDAARLLSLSGLSKIKKIKDGDMEIDKLDDKDNPKTPTPEDDCKVYNDDILDRVYNYDDPSINENDLLSKGQEALEKCAEITNGDWPEHALEDLIITAGMKTYYRSAENLPTN